MSSKLMARKNNQSAVSTPTNTSSPARNQRFNNMVNTPNTNMRMKSNMKTPASLSRMTGFHPSSSNSSSNPRTAHYSFPSASNNPETHSYSYSHSPHTPNPRFSQPPPPPMQSTPVPSPAPVQSLSPNNGLGAFAASTISSSASYLKPINEHGYHNPSNHHQSNSNQSTHERSRSPPPQQQQQQQQPQTPLQNSETQDSLTAIKIDRDRLLSEKSQWLHHVKSENAILLSLLSDVRASKAKIQLEIEALETERDEIKCMKMDGVVTHFEYLLEELPLGERGGNDKRRTKTSKAEGVHSLCCSIARKCRAVQERQIAEVVDAIRGVEDSFLKGGDIREKINEINLMGNNFGKNNGSGKRETVAPQAAPNKFQMNGMSDVVTAMSNHSQMHDEKLRVSQNESKGWKHAYEEVRRENMKIKAANAFSGINTDTMLPDVGISSPAATANAVASPEWANLPEKWQRVGLKSLKKHIRKRSSTHPRTSALSPSQITLIITETADAVKEFFAYCIYSSATSPSGIVAEEGNVERLCKAVLNSVVVDREVYPVLTMFLTYAGERRFVNREGEGEGEGEEGEGEEAEEEEESLVGRDSDVDTDPEDHIDEHEDKAMWEKQEEKKVSTKTKFSNANNTSKAQTHVPFNREAVEGLRNQQEQQKAQRPNLKLDLSSHSRDPVVNLVDEMNSVKSKEKEKEKEKEPIIYPEEHKLPPTPTHIAHMERMNTPSVRKIEEGEDDAWESRDID